MKTKLEELNSLQKDILSLEKFIDLLKVGGIYDEKHKGQNSFDRLSIRAYVYTGSDSIDDHRYIENSEIIKICADSLLIILSQILQTKKQRYNFLIGECYYQCI